MKQYNINLLPVKRVCKPSFFRISRVFDVVVWVPSLASMYAYEQCPDRYY